VFSKAIDGLGQLKLGTQGAIAAGPVGRDAALDGYFSQVVMTSDDNDL
jgi:lipid-binding SYLF domain-containing protein